MGWYSRFPKYVPVAERRLKAEREIEKQRKKGFVLQPVEIEGRKITTTFWGGAWCAHLESFSDFENRLPRGRTYVRNGSVCHLEISSGNVSALVSGSSLYRVSIRVTKLPDNKWNAVKEKCSGQVSSLLELLQGKFSNSVMTVVTHKSEGLFPSPSEIKMDCDCPDHAYMCKHLAAVLYGIGARLDLQPDLLFLLRGINHEELIEADTTRLVGSGTQSKAKRVADNELGDVFGIEIFDIETNADKVSGVVSAARNATAKLKPGTEVANQTRNSKDVDLKKTSKTNAKSKPKSAAKVVVESKSADQAKPKARSTSGTTAKAVSTSKPKPDRASASTTIGRQRDRKEQDPAVTSKDDSSPAQNSHNEGLARACGLMAEKLRANLSAQRRRS